MANLKDAASLINELSQETQLDLYKSWQHHQEAAFNRLVEIAKEKGQAGYDAGTVKRLIEEFVAEVQKNDENEDLELSEGELAAVSGGGIFTKMNNKAADAEAKLDQDMRIKAGLSGGPGSEGRSTLKNSKDD